MWRSQVRKRFALYPPRLVGVGDTWSRTIRTSLPGGAPGERFSTLSERYRLVSTQRASVPLFGVGKHGDVFLTLMVNTTETPPHDEAPQVPQGGGEDGGEGGGAAPPQRWHQPLLASPTAMGLRYEEHGTYTVHAESGMIVAGSTEVVVTGERDVLVVATGSDHSPGGEQMVAKADVLVRAHTSYGGTIAH